MGVDNKKHRQATLTPTDHLHTGAQLSVTRRNQPLLILLAKDSGLRYLPPKPHEVT